MMERSVRADENIKRDIVEELYWDERVNAAEINVEVLDGIVTLSGSVPTYISRSAAINDTWGIKDVLDVEDRINVIFPPTFEIPADAEINEMVRSTLIWNADIHSDNIDARVTNGVVTMTGTVDKYWKKWKAESLVAEVKGVVDVQNELAIVPTDNLLDKDIAEDVENALRRNLYVNSEDVIVKVERGKVTLTGASPTWHSRQKAAEVASHTAGVTEVENRLSIRAHKN